MSQIENSYFGEHSLGVRTPYSASTNRKILAGLVTAFDPPPPDEQGYTPSDKRPNRSTSNSREPTAGYREIGGTLLETEARYLAVGIPWFPQNCLSDRCQATANLPWKRDENSA